MNRLKFPGYEKFYTFSEDSFKEKYARLKPTLEVTRYKHEQTNTTISLLRTTFCKIKRELLRFQEGQENPFIVALYGCCRMDGMYYLCIEPMYICLYGLLDRFNTRTPECARDRAKREKLAEHIIGHIAFVFVNVLDYLHERGYIHGNVSQKSVLFRRDGVIKVSDVQLMGKVCMKHINLRMKKSCRTFPFYFNNVQEPIKFCEGDSWDIKCESCSPFRNDCLNIVMGERHVPPERFLKGCPIDTRNDIWAFATMLTYGANWIPNEMDEPFNRVIQYIRGIPVWS